MWLLICGLLFHSIFFLSVFDIYFRTPLITGMEPEIFDNEPVAQRVVLFVADGLRADTLFNFTNKTTLAPYIRSIIENHGTWGISHTRVPTESRPGHVAIIGGIYEDPSAITHGWKENPVCFDTVFNQSRHTWSWGSPDILPMFSRGEKKNHITAFTYPSEMQDFGSKDASSLDSWVFRKVESFFEEAKYNNELAISLNQSQNVFFLHLLGIDTNGHAHKPHSEEYFNNLKKVDKGVRKIVDIFREFFEDNKTAFLFTSDHGMTDWGSHGAGDQVETETPIIAWGAGVARPEDPNNFRDRMLYDPRVEQWGLNHVRRHDVHQADLAPLMAALIGIPVPVNSVGVLPVEYLIPDYSYRAQALFANARQILAHFRIRQKMKMMKTLPSLFKTFPLMKPEREIQMLTMIRENLRSKQFEQAILSSYELIWLTTKGIDYYLNYDRTFLTGMIFVGFSAWILLLISVVLKDHTSVPHLIRNWSHGRLTKKKSPWFGLVLASFSITSLLLLIAQTSPWQHYVYVLSAIFLWFLVFIRAEYLKCALLIMISENMFWEISIRVVVILIGVEILVFSFFMRPLLSLGLVFIGFWPFILNAARSNTEKSLRLCWIGAATLLASFTYMPVVGTHPNYAIVEIGGLLALLLLGFGLFCCRAEKWVLSAVPKVVYVQGALILVSVIVVHNTELSFRMKEGLTLANQIASWIILVSSFVLPLFGSENVMGRLVALSAALLCPFILLSIRHEVLFYIALGVAMFLWLVLEYHLSGDRVQIGGLKFSVWNDCELGCRQQLSWSDIRRAYFFLFFIILSFFGTGNIASVNSFDPRFVYCFVSVFSPFVMAGLLLLKIIIPFLLVSCFFKSICFLLKVPVRSLFLVFLILSDVMALQFFFLIRTEGSWLDIGSSLSHYVISMATTLFLMVLMQMADVLTTKSVWLLKSPRDTSNMDVLPRLSKSQHRD